MDRARTFTWRTIETQVNAHKVTEFSTTRIDLREAIMGASFFLFCCVTLLLWVGCWRARTRADFPMQDIITRDNVEIKVHPMLLYKIQDPVRAVYEATDLPKMVEDLVQTTLRSIIGDMGLDDTLASREEINRVLQQKIARTFLNWGFKIIKVDILEIVPATRTIQVAFCFFRVSDRVSLMLNIHLRFHRKRCTSKLPQSAFVVPTSSRQTAFASAQRPKLKAT